MVDLYAGADSGNGTSTIAGRGRYEETESGKVKAPDNIIKKVKAAKDLWQSARGAHIKRIIFSSSIEGLIAGNPPFPPEDLERLGLSHIANFNTLDALSMYERSAIGFFNLLHQAEYIARFEIKRFPGQKADVDLVEWQDIMAEEFDDIVRNEWEGFTTNMCTLVAQLVKIGLSPCIWPDERDWKWKTVEYTKFFVADQASTDISTLPWVCVETTWTTQELFQIYQTFEGMKEGDKKDNPWNMEVLAKVIARRGNEMAKVADGTNFNMAEFQKQLTNGDISMGRLYTDSFTIVSLLYKESDGKITHQMFDPLQTDSEDFLFMADRQYNKMQDAVVVLTASPGEFTFHANRGVGHKIYAPCQVMNQVDCSVADATRWASTPIIKTLALGSKEFSSIKFRPGVPTDIGTAEFVQNQMGGNIQQLVGASQYFGQKTERNAVNSGDNPQYPDLDQGSKSAPQVKMDSYKEFGVQNNNVATVYEKMNVIYKNMVVRMLYSQKGYPGYEEAKEWKERCLERGVAKEIFQTREKATDAKMPRHLKVFASQVAGNGSTLGRIMGLNAVGSLAGRFKAKGQDRWTREMIRAHMGPDYVNAFLADADVSDEQTGGASLAGVENFMMQQQAMPTFSPENEHEGHIGAHFALLKQTMDALAQKQMDSLAAEKIFGIAIPHTGQHIQYLSSDPLASQYLESIKKTWAQFTRAAELNRSRAEKQEQTELQQRQQAQQQQEQAMSKEALAGQVAQSEQQRKDFESGKKLERADAESKTRADLMKTKVQGDIDNERRKIDGQNAVKLQGAKESKASQVFDGVSTDQIRQDIVQQSGNTPSPSDFEPIKSDRTTLRGGPVPKATL